MRSAVAVRGRSSSVRRDRAASCSPSGSRVSWRSSGGRRGTGAIYPFPAAGAQGAVSRVTAPSSVGLGVLVGVPGRGVVVGRRGRRLLRRVRLAALGALVVVFVVVHAR